MKSALTALVLAMLAATSVSAMPLAHHHHKVCTWHHHHKVCHW